MRGEEIRERLESRLFEPFTIVTSAGTRYHVSVPYAAEMSKPGIIYVSIDDQVWLGKMVAISIMHVVALEPYQPETAREVGRN